jgi:ABC-type transport system substrate-binding protein
MDCPNDRYVNDEAICQAVVGMLARIGVKVNLLAQPKAQYFAKVLKPGGYQTSFYLLGWTPGTFDSHNVLYDIMGCRDEIQAAANSSISAATATRSRRARRQGAGRDRHRQARSADQAGVRDRASRITAISRCTSRRWPGACRKR